MYQLHLSWVPCVFSPRDDDISLDWLVLVLLTGAVDYALVAKGVYCALLVVGVDYPFLAVGKDLP